MQVPFLEAPNNLLLLYLLNVNDNLNVNGSLGGYIASYMHAALVFSFIAHNDFYILYLQLNIMDLI